MNALGVSANCLFSNTKWKEHITLEEEFNWIILTFCIPLFDLNEFKSITNWSNNRLINVKASLNGLLRSTDTHLCRWRRCRLWRIESVRYLSSYAIFFCENVAVKRKYSDSTEGCCDVLRSEIGYSTHITSDPLLCHWLTLVCTD